MTPPQPAGSRARQPACGGGKAQLSIDKAKKNTVKYVGCLRVTVENCLACGIYNGNCGARVGFFEEGHLPMPFNLLGFEAGSVV